MENIEQILKREHEIGAVISNFSSFGDNLGAVSDGLDVARFIPIGKWSDPIVFL